MDEKNKLLEYSVFEVLVEDDEHFEAVYFHVNNKTYKNMKINGSPLYKKLNNMYSENDIFTPIEVFDCIKKLIGDGYVGCYKIVNGKPLKIDTPEFRNFIEFNNYWLRLTKKGKERFWQLEKIFDN